MYQVVDTITNNIRNKTDIQNTQRSPKQIRVAKRVNAA